MTEVGPEEHPQTDPPNQDQPVGPRSADHYDDHLEEQDPQPVTAGDNLGEDPDPERWEWL